MSKLDLKQQAKSLLLKGCYKMAFNKYNRLIEMGAQGFSNRDWAIIHLNQAISLQFQDQPDKAIETIDRSLQIDPTYQKAYYRKLQILREINQHQRALYSVPIWIKNKQIEQLLKQIKEQYLNSLGMDQILEDLLTHNTHKIQFIKQSHSKFYQRVTQAIDSQCSNEHLKKVGEKIATYYKHLKQQKSTQIQESFLSKIHFILISQRQSKKKQSFHFLLSLFWEVYLEKAEPFHSKDFSSKDIKQKEQFKIVKYAPLSKNILCFLESLVNHQNIQEQCIFELSIQLSNNLSLYSKEIEYSFEIFKIITCFSQKVISKIDHKHLGWLKRSFILIDTLVKFHLTIEPHIIFQKIDQINMFYLHYYFANTSSENFMLEQTPFRKITMASIIQFLDANLEQFIVIYTFQHFIHRLDRSLIKELSPRIIQQLQVLHELKDISKQRGDKKKSLQIEMQKEYELIYTSLLLKIDLKNNNKIDIGLIMNKSIPNNKSNDGSLSDLQINTLLLLAISKKQHLLQILKYQKTITQAITQFINNTFLQQIQSIKIVTSFIYLLLIDLQSEQEENYANKMGTTVEQIRKAKQIQGEKKDKELIKQLSQSQNKFKNYVSKNWNEIVVNFSELLLKIKDEQSLKKWGKILNQIGKIDHSRFHNSKIISVLLQSFKVEKKDVGQLFSILCKKVNVDLIKYQYLQSIANALVYNIQKSDDQLVIFESLLGLINFTSNSNHKVRIPIKTIVDSAFEQNKYIVHASCSLLNNLLVYEQNEEIIKLVKLKQIVEKYTIYYREQIDNDDEVPLSDYSHPSRVYSTLLSLAMVLDLHQLYQFQDWSSFQICLLKIKTSRADILYKGVWYLSMKQRLKGKWWEKFEKDLIELKAIDYQRWLKLQQYIKK